MPNSSNSANSTLIIAVGILGAALIAAFTLIILFYEGDKTLALAGLVTIAGLVVPQIMTFKSSTENAIKIKALDEKQDINTKVTKDTYKLVDGQMTEFKRMMKMYADSEAELAGEKKLAEGIALGQSNPVIDPDPTLSLPVLAIDPSLKKATKPKVGDKQ